jgi:hypothetical protein
VADRTSTRTDTHHRRARSMASAPRRQRHTPHSRPTSSAMPRTRYPGPHRSRQSPDHTWRRTSPRRTRRLRSPDPPGTPRCTRRSATGPRTGRTPRRSRCRSRRRARCTPPRRAHTPRPPWPSPPWPNRRRHPFPRLHAPPPPCPPSRRRRADRGRGRDGARGKSRRPEVRTQLPDQGGYREPEVVEPDDPCHPSHRGRAAQEQGLAASTESASTAERSRWALVPPSVSNRGHGRDGTCTGRRRRAR